MAWWGSGAQDVEAPTIAFNETVQSNSLITITATDAGSGMKSLFYSLDSKNYQVYTGTFSINAAQTPIVYAFADDNVGNRSGYPRTSFLLPGVGVGRDGAADYGVGAGDVNRVA